ncbi:MAG: DUF4376 domain-containing protein [Rhodospirillales bacterium]
MSRFRFPDGQIVRVGQGYTRGDFNYPADWLGGMTEEERADLGLAPVPEAPDYDPRFQSCVETEPGVYTLADMPVADVRAAKLAELSARRYAKEIAGVSIGGLAVSTDRESQALITGAALAATLDAAYTVDWKTPAGFVTLSAVQLLGVAQAVRAHVQACFSAERAKSEAIAALDTAAAVLAYDLEAGWPG